MKSEDGITNILELLQAETSDGALYQCRAGNPFGADVYSVHLTILGEGHHQSMSINPSMSLSIFFTIVFTIDHLQSSSCNPTKIVYTFI